MYRKGIMSVVLLAVLSVAAVAAELADHLQNISVTIGAAGSQGSGVTFSRDGQTYVWTAGHVVDGLRSTRDVIDPKSGSNRKLVEFADAKVIKMLIEDGRTVGRVEFDAEVIRYSDSDNGEDLALLRVRKKNFATDSVVFYLDEKLPPLGTQLFHVGSLLGSMGSNSMTTGIVSQHGRLIGKTVYDQISCTIFPGSSGGGVYTTDGRYVGMVVRGAGETFGLCVPVRRMKDWATRAGVLWAIDPAIPMPNAEDLKKMPIEDIGSNFTADAKADTKEYPFPVIRRAVLED